MPPPPLLAVRGLRKAFSGAVALAGVDLDVGEREIHALVGENGAGKSTLVRVLGGLVARDSGEIRIAGQPVRIGSPAAASALGIAVVHQELSLVPELSVCENVFLGCAPRGRLPGLVDFRTMEERAGALFATLGVSLPLRQPLSRLGAGQRQLVEIARGLSRSPRLLLLDEPTSSLSPAETRELLRIARELRERGTSILLVSHKLDEIFAAADRITVLRDGARVASRAVGEWTEAELVRSMVGRDLAQLHPRTRTPHGEVVLRASGLTRLGHFEDVSFELHRGEVLGMAGLVGAGRSDVARALFGLAPATRGTLHVGGRPVAIRSPEQAMRCGIALVPEDRRIEGIVPERSTRENVALASLAAFSRGSWLRLRRERQAVAAAARRVGLADASLDLPVRQLSGGNQQKAVLARWLLRDPRVLILDEPTRGIDVGARAEIHALVDRLAGEGTAVLLISSDLPEILALSDRILVMRAGRVAGELARAEASEERVVALASGVREPEAHSA